MNMPVSDEGENDDDDDEGPTFFSIHFFIAGIEFAEFMRIVFLYGKLLHSCFFV